MRSPKFLTQPPQLFLTSLEPLAQSSQLALQLQQSRHNEAATGDNIAGEEYERVELLKRGWDVTHRECVEESGWAPDELRLLHRFHPIAGQSTQTFWLFGATGATRVGEPDGDETDRVEWHDDDAVRGIVERNEVLDGLSVIALLGHLAGR